MTMKTIIPLVLFASFIATACTSTIDYQQELAKQSRPAEDIAKDATRHPAEVLSFFELKKGMKVLDLFSGAGYYSEIVSGIVGKDGKVDAHNNAAYINYIGPEKMLARYADNRLSNVREVLQEANDLQLCVSCYDRVLMILTFHDLYHVDEKNGWNKIDAPALLSKIKLSLKPNGLVGIVDHIAPSGSGEQAGQTLHRIDPQFIKDKMQQWGFILVGEADFLANTEDSGELPMWDDTVKGKTNRAVMKFARRN
ncbi:MAG: putative methyltransferase [Paraglaciecola sp.]|jgi:predicted methyltransferase